MKAEAVNNDSPNISKKRQQRGIKFPYADYEKSAKLVEVINENVGYGECTKGQLAAWVDQNVKNSAFNNQVAAARLFGIIETGEFSDRMRLSELGRRTIDPSEIVRAKSDAFLMVPLFKALYEKYKDCVTPSKVGLEAEIVVLGVPEKQKVRARQVFTNSAHQTGFRDAAPTKLVMPVTKVQSEILQSKNEIGNNNKESGEIKLDVLIQALVDKIPPGNSWPAKNRLRWFRTFAMIVSQVYDTDNSVVELRIDLDSSPFTEEEEG